MPVTVARIWPAFLQDAHLLGLLHVSLMVSWKPILSPTLVYEPELGV